MQWSLKWQPDDSAATKLAKLEQRLQGTSLALEHAVPLLAALLSLPLPEDRYPASTLNPQQQRHQTQDVLVAWLLEEAERRPILAVWEDLHWADSSTLETLGLFVEQTPTASMLHVLAFRPEFTPPWPTRSHMTPLTLHRLERLQVESLIAHLADAKALPAEVVEHIVAKTDGVPLYVEELAKMLLQSSLLHKDADQYVLTGPLTAVSIPDTLRDSLMARLDQMQTAKEVAQLGAVLGREFAYDMLQGIASQNEETLQAGLARLVAAEVLYQRGRPPQARYIFKHALIQDAAYQSLLKKTRQQYHQRIAHVLETYFPHTVEAQPELLAHHYTEAGLQAQAIAYWQRAGERANARSAYVEAMAHLRKGLELLRFLPETAARARHELLLHYTLAASLTATQSYTAPEVGQTYLRAHQLCQQIGETPELFPVLAGLLRFYVNRGEVQTGRELGEQLLRLAHHPHDAALLQQAHFLLGFALSTLGEFALARAHFEQSLASYTPQPLTTPISRDLAGTQIGCLIMMAPVLWHLGYPDQALPRIHDALRLAHELAHPFTLAVVFHLAARVHQSRREVQAAQERAEAVITLASEQGFPLWVTCGKMSQGWTLAMQGQAEAGIAQMRQCLSAHQDVIDQTDLLLYWCQIAEAYGAGGQAEEGLSILAEALAMVDNTGMRHREAEVYWLQGELLLKQGLPDTSRAEACFHQALGVAQQQQAKSWELRAATSLARLWQQQGKTKEAYDLLTPVYDWFTEGFDTVDLQEAKTLLAELA